MRKVPFKILVYKEKIGREIFACKGEVVISHICRCTKRELLMVIHIRIGPTGQKKLKRS